MMDPGLCSIRNRNSLIRKNNSGFCRQYRQSNTSGRAWSEGNGEILLWRETYYQIWLNFVSSTQGRRLCERSRVRGA